MPAYIVLRVEITDPEQYKEYRQRTPPALQKYGAKFIARSSTVETLEGEPENRRVVIIEFETMEQARNFYNSPEYQSAKVFREGAADAQFILIDGVE